ncbi:MAG: transposase [Verrucomicrobia bacterium]|nr:transposase [Verrucomicrobiota bacterium]
MANRFTEEQIINILGEAQAGGKVAELCRRHGISSATYYLWKSKYTNMTIPEAKRLRALEEENSRLKRIVADQQHDIVALKDVLTKKW